MPVIELSIDSKGAVHGLKQYDKSVKNSENQTKKSFSKMQGYAAKLAGAFATYQIVDTIKEIGLASIRAASDLQEVQGKFDVVFRNLGDYAEDSAKRIADSYGMSNRESKEYMSSLQDLLVPSGLARDKAAEMSVAFTELAADLGSFNNQKTSVVIRDIQSALAGGSETMTKYGIDVKVAAVNAEMLRQGLDTSTAAAKRQSRTIALLSIMQRDSADAMGDFARTSDSFANQLKTAQGNLENMRAELGKRLLPIVTKGLQAFNDWASAAGRMDEIAVKMIGTMQFLHDGFNGVKTVAHGLIYAFALMVNSLVKLLTPFELLLEAAKKLGMIDSNPLKNFMDDVQTFTDSALDGLQRQIDKSVETSQSYEKMKNDILSANKEVAASNKKVAESSAEVAAAAKRTADINEMISDKDLYRNKKAREEAEARIQREYKLQTAIKKGEEAENNLKTAVDSVTKSASASVGALTKQADAANKVAAAAKNIQSATRTKKGTYKASKAWSGGSYTFSGSSFESTLSKEELAIYKSMTPSGRGNDFYKTYGNRPQLGAGMGGGNSHDYLDRIQLQHDSARDYIERMRKNGGSAGWSNQNVFNFNQQVSRSDITNITNAQQTNGARA